MSRSSVIQDCDAYAAQIVRLRPFPKETRHSLLDEEAKGLAAQDAKPEDVAQDAEGLQTMRTLAKHMAWMLKCIEAGKAAGVALPQLDPIIRTNFVR